MSVHVDTNDILMSCYVLIGDANILFLIHICMNNLDLHK